MKCSVAFSILAVACVRGAAASQSNPLGKVIQLMDSLAAKLVADGDAEDKAFHKYVEWCDETTANQKYAIDTATTKSSELGATIAKATSDIEAAEGKIGDLAGKIAKAEGELKDATLIRNKEAAEFSSGEAELTETLSALSRAIDIISKEMAKNPAAFVQMDVSGVTGLVAALSTIVDAASLGGADKDKLVAFAQEQRDAARLELNRAMEYQNRMLIERDEKTQTELERLIAENAKAEADRQSGERALRMARLDVDSSSTVRAQVEASLKDARSRLGQAEEELSVLLLALEQAEAPIRSIHPFPQGAGQATAMHRLLCSGHGRMTELPRTLHGSVCRVVVGSYSANYGDLLLADELQNT